MVGKGRAGKRQPENRFHDDSQEADQSKDSLFGKALSDLFGILAVIEDRMNN
jgi:hypothetical protein